MTFTEKELVDFANYMILLNGKTLKPVSDANLRNFFGANYDNIQVIRKKKLKELFDKH